MGLAAAYSYFKSRFTNVGYGTSNSVYVPNHTLPAFTLRGGGQPILTWVRAVGQNQVYYGLSIANAPVQGAGRIAGSIDYVPLQNNLAVPLGDQIVPTATLPTSQSF
jgi:hypothetical protein